MEEQIGTLAAGKLADITVVDGNPLEDIARMQQIHMVVKGGAVVARDGAIVWSPSA